MTTETPEMTAERQVELLEKLASEIRALLGHLKLTYPVKVTPTDKYFDGFLAIDEASVEVHAYLDKQNREWYEIGHNVHYPGVRYYKDGSGDPPSDEFVEDTHVNAEKLIDAAAAVVGLAFNCVLSDVIEARCQDLLHESELQREE